MKLKTKITGCLICILLLPACSTSSVSIKEIDNLGEGGQLPSAEGVLVGNLRWQQGEQGIAAHGDGRYQGPYTTIVLRNTASNEVYRHWLKTPDFRLVLPPGQYVFEQVLGARLAIRVDRGTMERAAPWLLNVVTLPLGTLMVPSEKINLWFKPALPTVVITEGEASYIGALIADVPDPLPNGPLKIHIRTADEGVEMLKDFESRFPGTVRVEKSLLISE